MRGPGHRNSCWGSAPPGQTVDLCTAHADYQQAILRAGEQDIVRPTGYPAYRYPLSARPIPNGSVPGPVPWRAGCCAAGKPDTGCVPSIPCNRY